MAPGALAHIWLGYAEREALIEIRQKAGDTIITVCRTDRQSANAETVLRDAGLKNLLVLRGAMVRWKELGFETDQRRREGEGLGLALEYECHEPRGEKKTENESSDYPQ